MFGQGVEERQGAGNVVLVVVVGPPDGVGDDGEGGAVDGEVHVGMVGEYAAREVGVGYVAAVEGSAFEE